MSVTAKLKNNSWSSLDRQKLHQPLSSVFGGWDEHRASPLPGQTFLRGWVVHQVPFFPLHTQKQCYFKTCLKWFSYSSRFSFIYFLFSLVKVDWFWPATGNVFLSWSQARGKGHSLYLGAWGEGRMKESHLSSKTKQQNKTKPQQEHLAQREQD